MNPRTPLLVVLALALVSLALACSSGTDTATRETCPITIPPQPAFVPPAPYPAEAPPLYRSVWYGTAELWTMLDPDGEVWPIHANKTFWWSESFEWRDELQPAITVAARRLDGSDYFEEPGPATHGFRNDTVQFMLRSVSFPGPGCWEISATYKGATLSYVLLITE